MFFWGGAPRSPGKRKKAENDQCLETFLFSRVIAISGLQDMRLPPFQDVSEALHYCG